MPPFVEQRNRAGPTVRKIQPEDEIVREGGDEQLRARVYCALLRSRNTVLSANFKYCGPLDIVRLNHMLKVLNSLKQAAVPFGIAVCYLFRSVFVAVAVPHS